MAIYCPTTKLNFSGYIRYIIADPKFTIPSSCHDCTIRMLLLLALHLHNIIMSSLQTIGNIPKFSRGIIFMNRRSLVFFTINFAGLILADVHDHAHYALYSRAYFTGIIFASSQFLMKVGPLENSHHRKSPTHLQNLHTYRHQVVYTHRGRHLE